MDIVNSITLWNISNTSFKLCKSSNDWVYKKLLQFEGLRTKVIAKIDPETNKLLSVRVK